MQNWMHRNDPTAAAAAAPPPEWSQWQWKPRETWCLLFSEVTPLAAERETPVMTSCCGCPVQLAFKLFRLGSGQDVPCRVTCRDIDLWQRTERNPRNLNFAAQ
ncbi:hypothetical protein JDV02_004008 [Purpureocillium takamizusanense]|uniref:Uncharacterized protein n=1 Tax=Purpureocillium takamizusanense TaxID=2060973 RepID=A0A9Q8QDW8_9HYPO|nr:uncharacterized protein JDV02_004008 [Purpureocillium takamizusanense]UNI17683.1 hypothetical protein JDV02_004008 [Purpureocillium takamizusanense]